MSSGLFEKYRNPDGTYNGLRLLSDLSGVPEQECWEIWERLKKAKGERKMDEKTLQVFEHPVYCEHCQTTHERGKCPMSKVLDQAAGYRPNLVRALKEDIASDKKAQG